MEFVRSELARELKEKGFKEECLCHYIGEELVYNLESPIANNQMWFCHNKYDNIWHRDNYDAPTISQALKWLREECGIFILIEPDILHPEYRLTFTIRIKFYIKGEEDEGFSYKYLSYRKNSYEEATLAGIEYVLDNLI